MLDSLDIDQNLIHFAARGDLAGVALLLSQGANPLWTKSAALRWASLCGHAECVRLLIPLSDPKAGYSRALRRAALKGHAECVKLLIPASNPKALASAALHDAACQGHAECVRLLIPVSASLIDMKHTLLQVFDAGRAGILSIMLSHEPRFLDGIDLAAMLVAARAANHFEIAALLLSIIEQHDLNSHLCQAPAATKKPSL